MTQLPPLEPGLLKLLTLALKDPCAKYRSPTAMGRRQLLVKLRRFFLAEKMF